MNLVRYAAIPEFTAVYGHNLLIDQNYRSYNTRYNIDNSEQTPIYKFYYEAKAYKEVQILKACSCYDYQCCETNDYYETDAHKIIDDTRHLAISNLPGYDDAEWEITEPRVVQEIDHEKSISIVWEVEDVQNVRSDLTEEKCIDVLQNLKRNHDACMGINWDTIELMCDDLYPKISAE